MTDIIEIAHRGNSDLHKDNTINAFISALDEEFDMIELDIQLCKSGEIVIFHDLSINGKMIIDMDFNDILEIEPDLIKLEEFFEIPGMKEAEIYLDLKGGLDIANEITDFITDNNLNMDNILIGSFNLKHLDIIHALEPELKLGLITSNNLNDSLYCKLAQFEYLYFICISWDMLDKDSIEILKLLEIKIYTYTCSNHTILDHMLEYDINGIVTNFKIINNTE
jgi:glycerophosphoryl diester phosphodiesterase